MAPYHALGLVSDPGDSTIGVTDAAIPRAIRASDAEKTLVSSFRDWASLIDTGGDR
jgi:hypothetical protein